MSSAIRGQRFHLDLDRDARDGSPLAETGRSPESRLRSSFNFVGDVKERAPTAAQPPSVPVAKDGNAGFPAHKKRAGVSRFKAARGVQSASSPAGTQGDAGSPGWDVNERRRIDEENRQRLASMSHEEIEREREELLAGVDPSLLRSLLNRAHTDDKPQPGSLKSQARLESVESKHDGPKPPAKKVSFAGPSAVPHRRTEIAVPPIAPTVPSVFPEEDAEDEKSHSNIDPDRPPNTPPTDLRSLSAPAPTVHFPRPAALPDLDPSSETFLEDLHQKYFPTLPADPLKLSWMKPSPHDHGYEARESGFAPSEIRFSFSGELLPPSVAEQIPVTKGLHHHGLAPGAAGYTIPELSRLARSVVPAQRCIAFQTLGRLLLRLGIGEFGAEDNEGADLADGLWRCIEEGRVIDSLLEGAGADAVVRHQEGNEATDEDEGAIGLKSGHLSAKNYALEALWLWRKGGGKRWKAQ